MFDKEPTLSFYNNLSTRLHSILLYFITLNKLYCTAASKTVLNHVIVIHFVLVSPLEP